jgi:F-type H+-transporting ATPase subunit delta
MSDHATIARPYAKAIFEHALAKNELLAWSGILKRLAQVVIDPSAERFISNPSVTTDVQCQFLLSTLAEFSSDVSALDAFVQLLSANKRLLVVPEICVQFEALRALQEKTLTVSVVSVAPLTDKHQQHLVSALSKRLNRQVSLEMSRDASLIGGAIIRAGDLVIDGSVRTKLTKLGTDLAA